MTADASLKEKQFISTNKKTEEGVTSVVGEMLLLVLVVILVSIMAASVFNLLPGEREKVIDVTMDVNDKVIYFWHHGGDWTDKRDLSIYMMKSDGSGTTASISATDKRLTIYAYNSSSGDYTVSSDTFDLGCRISAEVPSDIESGNYDIRLIDSEKVIAAYDRVRLK
ncbi:FlaG/FlaF family flagellin (archaellin) [Methanomicrobium sp. W14]|uniref:type IV pilin n=1 Tax=Methanomicrobium sp. W14 TaxID=2817839 RepID=UPI001AE43648|nr:type IV pilin [Methanomicrobium sp. W14]MBP2133141.1 FlaG/FlaF family flagellin (archaellin) [Methanomicrobium sp. W14]